MSAILDALQDYPVQEFAAGDFVLEQGDSTGLLYILIEGSVEVIKEDVTVAKTSDPGAVFGDLFRLARCSSHSGGWGHRAVTLSCGG